MYETGVGQRPSAWNLGEFKQRPREGDVLPYSSDLLKELHFLGWTGAQPPPDVEEDDCLLEYRHLFCPDLLRDKVAFITGGGSGSGLRIAEVFMRLPGSWPLPLASGAAGNFLCPASVLSFNAFKTVMDIDALGTFNVSRVLYEKFFWDHGGVIVNITVTLGTRGQVLQAHAGSAKAAVDAMTRHLAVEWGPQNIRVNSLAPGPISGTEGFRRLGGSQASTSMDVLASPLRRLGNKTEVAHSALYLASPLASYVTGAVLVVDGGAWLTFPNDVKLLEDFASSAKL
ncbi:Peroxisomal 2,4-Dienoyl-Coa Reductase [Manis pentadactyla]|nr:Peroxisomal 2,4-Dienoyl-Coa Reductase [Manis pentadactyla]